MRRQSVRSSLLILMLLITHAGCGGDIQQTATVPGGTQVLISLNNAIGTESNESGDTFDGVLAEPLTSGGQTIIPAGTSVSGKLVTVDEPGRVSGRAGMTLTVTQIDGNGVNTNQLTLEADSGTRDDLEKIAAGAVVGALIGGIAEGGEGAAIGGAIGAGAGGAVVLATKGDHLRLESGQKLVFQTTGSNELPVMAQK